MNAIDVQEAFRRGIRGVDLAAPAAASGLAEDAAAFASGANETTLLSLDRLPGLRDAHAAYETGRALRMIIRLFDQAGAPERIGRQFIDNLAGAVVVEHMRRHTRPWGAADTVDMFIEMYARILGDRQAELDQVRRAVMDYAVTDERGGRAQGGGRLGAIFRRRRALNGAA